MDRINLTDRLHKRFPIDEGKITIAHSICKSDYSYILYLFYRYLTTKNFVVTCLAPCLEEIAYHSGFIDRDQLLALAKPMAKNQYGQYLVKLAAS